MFESCLKLHKSIFGEIFLKCRSYSKIDVVLNLCYIFARLSTFVDRFIDNKIHIRYRYYTDIMEKEIGRSVHLTTCAFVHISRYLEVMFNLVLYFNRFFRTFCILGS